MDIRVHYSQALFPTPRYTVLLDTGSGIRMVHCTPHPAIIENEIQPTLHNYLHQLNHQTPPHKDIFHTSLGPQHDLIMIHTPSTRSKPPSTGIFIKEEKSDYTDFLFQDSQDPWKEFLPLSQHLQQFSQPTMDEPGPSQPGPLTQPSKKTNPNLQS